MKVFEARSPSEELDAAHTLALPFEDLTLKNLAEDVDTIEDLERVGPRSGSRTRALVGASPR